MIVLPGPAVLVIPVGLGVLATELVWARRLLNKLKSTLQRGKGKNHPRETK
jgi:Putative transmembrane protein (PGPGW)